jgi:Ca2+-binding RTX toxin-like protein
MNRAIIDLMSGEGKEDAGGDKYASIENVIGSNYNDIIRGDAQANYLSGEGGKDIIYGGGGRDELRGGTGTDRFTYESLADLSGDRILDWNGDEDDRIDLSGLGVTFDEINPLGGGLIQSYNIVHAGSTYNFTVISSTSLSPSAEHLVFIL